MAKILIISAVSIFTAAGFSLCARDLFQAVRTENWPAAMADALFLAVCSALLAGGGLC